MYMISHITTGWLLVLGLASMPFYGESPPLHKTPSKAEIDQAINLAGSYMERVCGPAGRFVYRTEIQSGKQSESYNIVRHEGAIYALTMLQRGRKNQETANAVIRASTFLRQNYVGPGVRVDQLVVWSKPLPESSPAELGATGLGLVALTGLEDVKPGSVPLSQLEALGRFVIFLQKDDGSFISKYRSDSGADETFESLYYPGEAALGLIDLYETDHSSVWLKAAAKALSYLAKSRSTLSEVPPDHWALIATAKLLTHYPQSASPTLRKELIQHAVQVCRTLMKDQERMPTDESLDGSFDATGRTAPTATRMEGLLAALEFLPEGSLRDQVKDTVDRGIAFLLRTQIQGGIYAGAMPNAHLAASPDAFYIRIDFVQHALCAWLQYQRMFSRKEAAQP
jgi:hypothetical protein